MQDSPEGVVWIIYTARVVSLNTTVPIVFLWTLVYSNKGTSAGRRGLEMQVYAAAPNWETGKHKVVIHHGERCFYGWLLKIILKIIAFNRLLFRNEKKVCYTI